MDMYGLKTAGRSSQSTYREKFLLLTADILAFLLAFMVVYVDGWWFYEALFGETPIGWWEQAGERRALLYGLLTCIALIWFWGLGHYKQRKPFWDELLEVIRVLAIIAVMDAALVFFGSLPFSRLLLMLVWSLAVIFVPLFRVFIKHILIRTGKWQRPTVIIGTGANAGAAAAALDSELLLGFDIIAFLTPIAKEFPSNSYMELGGRPVPVLAINNNPETVLNRLGRPHVVVALEAESLHQEKDLIKRLYLVCKGMNIVPPLNGLPLFGFEMSHFFSHEVLFLGIRSNLSQWGPRSVKRVFDIFGTILLLLVFSPLIIYITLQLWRTSGKVIYNHKRIGKNGKMFTCYKFCTMVLNADEVLQDILKKDLQAKAEWEQCYKLKQDPRITPFGRLLRRLSLDELPQLWNVLKGDMSLVGPRPVVPMELKRYGDQADCYLESGPGITGLWQISGRNDLDYNNRVYLDVWYARNWSLWFDIVILLRTTKAVLVGKGAY